MRALYEASDLLGEAKSGRTLDMERWAAAFNAEQRAEGLAANGESSSFVAGYLRALRSRLDSERDAALKNAA